MSTTTQNLLLTKPAETDKVDIKVLNTNFDKIDTAVGNNTSKITSLENTNKTYYANYNSDTYSNISDYLKNGYFVVAVVKSSTGNNGGAPLVRLDADAAYFGKYDSYANSLVQIKCTSDNVWSRNVICTPEGTSNKTTALSSSSTNTQYPTAKCVYDNTARKPVEYKFSLGTSWTTSSNIHSQTATVLGITSNDTPIIDVDMSKITTQATGQTMLDNYALIGKAVAGTDKITFYCYDGKPTTSISLKALVIR